MSPKDTDSNSDEHELVSRQTTLDAPARALAPFQIQRTVDWEVSSESEARSKRLSDDQVVHAV
jgi:hypothetical protein